jgi:pimeloyl-ACP methyl ester carboxylesterase
MVWWTAGVGRDPDPASGGELDLDAMVALVVERATTPGRPRAPRLAEALAGAERVDVATPHGAVAAWRVGDGPAVLLVHGWRDSARLWDPLIAELRARGRAVVAFDLPAHGFSEGDRCMVAEVTDAVLAVAAALGPIDAAVAHSFASSGTCLAVAEGVPVERLVLIAPPLAYRNPSAPTGTAGAGTDAGHQRWRRIAGELGFDAAVGDRALAAYRATLGPARAAWDMSAALSELGAEVRLLASVDDERFDIVSAQAMASAHLPPGAFVELTGLDHRGSARAAPAVAAIAGFVAPAE